MNHTGSDKLLAKPHAELVLTQFWPRHEFVMSHQLAGRSSPKYTVAEPPRPSLLKRMESTLAFASRNNNNNNNYYLEVVVVSRSSVQAFLRPSVSETFACWCC